MHRLLRRRLSRRHPGFCQSQIACGVGTSGRMVHSNRMMKLGNKSHIRQDPLGRMHLSLRPLRSYGPMISKLTFPNPILRRKRTRIEKLLPLRRRLSRQVLSWCPESPHVAHLRSPKVSFVWRHRRCFASSMCNGAPGTGATTLSERTGCALSLAGTGTPSIPCTVPGRHTRSARCVNCASRKLPSSRTPMWRLGLLTSRPRIPRSSPRLHACAFV